VTNRAEPHQRKGKENEMKRLLILTGILTALVGIAVILPALANYGHPGPVVKKAPMVLLAGSLVTFAGGAVILYGVRKSRA
jgi:hypothetical protein